MANNNKNMSNQNENLGRVVLFNSTGLPKTRCHMIKVDIIKKLKPLVILLNETKLNSEDDREKLESRLELNQYGYKFKTKSKTGINPGGGVAFIYRDNLNVKQITPPPQFKDLEAIICEVSGKYLDKWTICTYYNNPKLKIDVEFLYWISQYENLLLMGDLNAKHESLFCNSQNTNGQLLSYALESSQNPLNLCYLNDRSMTKRPIRKN